MNCRVPQSCYIGKLPTEILSNIFLLAAHGTPSDLAESLPSVTMMPHVLATVNLHWRTVALCNHNLWSSLVIDLQKVICNQSGDGLTPLTTMITRSGQSSMDIIIRAQQGPTSGTEEMIKKDFTKTMSRYADCMPLIFNLLFHEMYRWRSLEIISDTWMPIHSALQVLNERRMEGPGALRLESIRLKRTNDYLSRFWLFCPRIMKMVEGTVFGALIGAASQDISAQSPPLPKLRNIALYGVHLNWANFLHHTLGATPSLSSPVSHCIQSLELSHHSGEVRPTSDEFSAILEACPRLQNLVLRRSGPQGGFSRQVSLPLLQQLYYGYFSFGDDVGTFNGFHAPNLIKLSLEGQNLSGTTYYSPTQDDGEDDKADSILKHCASHLPFPKLQELSLYNVNAPVKTFTLFIATIPMLSHLVLHRTSNALPALLPIPKSLAGGAGMPCPALKSIQIFPESQKNKLIVTLKERSTRASRISEWRYEEMLEGTIFTLEDGEA
ncbi:hypothetical protein EV702DRAFT_965294 [Suillus placidus]|uniref:F-box domain-containing protein n=1 Tax=Suillus placidus TaxID=48579 RepID=A0A9P7A172_9AGAM|nr:hypothetical protein EV702DRAFT_965294 [Suillus placidus]